jgi:L-threonylcarbamoyladenylate synthase
LAAPSANLFGSISPTNAKHVYSGLNGKIDLVIDGGQCEKGVESTIVGFDQSGNPVLYRPGAITIERIKDVIGEIKIHTKDNVAPEAPGMLDKHYSPMTPAYLTDDPESALSAFSGKRVGVIMFSNRIEEMSTDRQIILSEIGDFNEAAASLYSSLHAMDKLELDVILIQKLPNQGLGVTINDRLTRATKPLNT